MRVAVFSTGNVGSAAIRYAVARSGFELCAVWVHDAARAGRDVADLVTLDDPGPTGVVTTASVDEVVAARPDCVVYTCASPDIEATYLPHYLTLLRAGINVTTVSSPGLVYPAAWDQGAVAQLEEAAAAGGATIYASGVEPGFAGDQLVAVLATLSGSITSVRTQEIFDYDDYGNEFLMREVFGFGLPLDRTPLMQLHGSQAFAWGPPVHYVAAAIGVELDSVRETYERVATPRDLEVAMGTIAAGTAGAVRMETIGVVDGRDFVVIEHVNRMAPDLAPHWPTAARDGTYRIVVTGEPHLTCELTIGATEEESSADGLVATAMRLLNAVPHVVAAGPGLVSSLDLPLTLPDLG